MDEITPEQKKQLSSWADQRDAILLDISVKREEQEGLAKKNATLSESNTEVADRIQQSIGRLFELEKKEKERALLIVPEIADLSAEKTVLQTQVSGLGKEIIALKDTKDILTEDIGILSKTHSEVFEQVRGLEGIVQGITRIASENGTTVNNILIEAGMTLQKVIEVGEVNVQKTNKVILEIPKIIVDLHRDILERRTIKKNRSIITQP